MTRLQTIVFLIFGFLSTILFEIFFNYLIQSSSLKITLLEHIQSSLKLTTLINVIILGSIFLILLMGLLVIVYGNRIFIIYMTLLKFFELIPVLIDLINLLFIYQYKIKDIHQLKSSNRLNLSLILTIIRLIISLDVIRRKCDCRWKRQMIVIVDLSLFILVNISLIRYSNKNPIRIGRKIILGLFIFHLNNLFYNETFNFTLNQLKIIHLILSIRWIISSFIILLFIFYTFSSIKIAHNDVFFKYCGLTLQICIIILCVIWRIKKKHRTCLVCYDDKVLSEFDGLKSTNCQHGNRSICNVCLFHHVQQTFQITFTDDIHCPELGCGVKLDYNTVKNILFLNKDYKLVERYDRYVTHRELEQMDEFIWCSNPSCNVGQLNEGGRSNYIVTCFNCHQKTCFIHKVQWHEAITCEEYDLNIDPDYESSRRWIVENSKKCPNCPYQIEKNDGCDHMACIKCRHEFCWSCLADFQPIRQDGNHRHKSTCKHYAPYDEE